MIDPSISRNLYLSHKLQGNVRNCPEPECSGKLKKSLQTYLMIVPNGPEMENAAQHLVESNAGHFCDECDNVVVLHTKSFNRVAEKIIGKGRNLGFNVLGTVDTLAIEGEDRSKLSFIDGSLPVATFANLEDMANQSSAPKEPVRVEQRPGRNEPCHCGSGKKYKKCHLAEDKASA